MKKFFFCFSLLFLFSFKQSNQVQEQFFIAKSECQSKNNDQLEIAHSYKVIGMAENKVTVLINGNESEFSTKCGVVKTFVPFFSDDESEFIPKAPNIDDFDAQVLNTCGEWGQNVSKNDFKKLLQNNPNLTNELYNTLNKSTSLSVTQNMDAFIESMSEIWSNSNGFQHIFCGVPYLEKSLGGLHFFGRYLEMNKKGYIGLDTSCSKNEVNFPVYTVAVEYVKLDGNINNKCPNGYSYTLHAKDILANVTNVYKYNNNSRGCMYTINDSINGDYYAFFSSDSEGAVVTSFPIIGSNYDGSPQCQNVQ